MSGVEVVAAVSAIISAFHGASELLKHIKAKRRKTRQALKEFEERQLQTSLDSGEQQIGLRYAQDLREFGEHMRIGDVVAHHRLQHITIVMQAQVIRDLQMAAQYDNAIINLTMLHEASITNKRDAIVCLDELKQRLDMRRIPRRIEDMSVGAASNGDSIGVHPMNSSSRTNSYFSAVTIPSEADANRPRNSFAQYFARKRHDSASSSSLTSPTPDINFSPAFEQLARARGTQDRALIMQDIDHIIDAYQGLQVHRGPSVHRESVPWSPHRTMLEPDARHFSFPSFSGQSGQQTPLDPLLAQDRHSSANYQAYPAFEPGMLDPRQAYNQPPAAAQNPYPQFQTQDPRSRFSAVSGSSSHHSDASSLNRNSSTSSQDSPAQSPLPLQFPARRPIPNSLDNSPSAQYPEQTHDERFSPATQFAEMEAAPYRPAPSSQTDQSRYLHSDVYDTLPQVPHNPNVNAVDISSLHYSPYAMLQPPADGHDSTPQPQTSHHRSSLQEQRNAEATLNRPRYNVVPNLAPQPPSSRNKQRERSVSQSIISATTLGTAPAAAGLRDASIAPSVASNDSSGSTPLGVLPGTRNNLIRQSTIQSGGSERMMDGRPCKANNYWGFCKGSWTIREDSKKGLKLRTLPSGMYNTKEIWECAECTFQGATFSAPHPHKKNRTQAIVDARAHTSQAGIRFRWIFLAKSHVKKPSQDSHIEGANYGCTLCCVQGNVSSIYGGVETLMNHIALCHVADMNERTRKKVNCIIGRVARDDEDWDLNIPVFTTGA